ncbi:tripartite motif-containing protein 12A-like [Dunckerocampus dactyliophorus]|uniref:tripartite motif-containing protein 12A-like n=1 Tax=Dunckerocampus dactyliophorus TaxID=161453 RepID=UPI002404AF82|nr:tripartite motif-containing protein 12A-like [Dunckerocampus dactyliophorus]
MAFFEDLQCPACFNIFEDPVMLPCSHSFCRSCVKKWWKGKEVRSCLVCMVEYRSKKLTPNLVLRNVCEAFLMESEARCRLHDEKLKLFCLDHQQPVCLVCRDAKIHANHKFSPIGEVAKDHREDLQKDLQAMQITLEELSKCKDTFIKQAENFKLQRFLTESEIKIKFMELHNVLQEEEEARLSAVREEKQQKSQIIKEKLVELSRDIEALSDVIKSTEKQLAADDISFMNNYKDVKTRVQQLPEESKLLPGPLLDMDKHLDKLKFTVWGKLKEMLFPSPALLNINPVLNQKISRGWHPLNLNKWFAGMDAASLEVTHVWNIEVGDNKVWEVGVLIKGRHKAYKCGIRFRDGKYQRFSPRGESLDLYVKDKLQRIRFCVDADKGRLSFHDHLTNTQVDTYDIPWRWLSVSSKELYPYFSTKDDIPLKMLAK